MKSRLVFTLGFLLTIALTFMACDTGNGSNDGGFVSQTVSIQNNKDTLGLTGTTAASNKTNIATGTIDSGEIKITSVAEGYATITVSSGPVDTAGISISVSNTGAINIAYISKYNGPGSGTLTATGNKTYNVFFGDFSYASDQQVQAVIVENGWTDSIVNADDGKYLKGADANAARTFFLNHPYFDLGGGEDGTWDYLANEFTHSGIGLPDGDLKTKMGNDLANCPLAGMFRSNEGVVIVFYASENKD